MHLRGLYLLFLFGLSAVLLYLVIENARHRRNLRRIPHRVLVNGIRGKSSITRLIAGALRADPHHTVVAKTTGTAARLIYPGGRETPVRRRNGTVNVIEQIGVVAAAVANRATTLVVECMAVMPDLQDLNQQRLIRSTIGVLCNVRADHLAEMGPTLPDVARSLSRSMPHGGVCVTAERDQLPVLRDEAARRRCRLIVVDPASVTDADMAPFSWVTFKDNVAIALEVAALLGVPRHVALTGMYAAEPDPGVLRVDRVDYTGRPVDAVNLFAANDPESTVMNLDLLRERRKVSGPVTLVINCRPDRVERNGQMGELVARIDPAQVVLIGTPTRSAARSIDARWQHAVVDLDGEHRTGQQLLHTIWQGLPARSHTLVMVGNIHGRGEVLLDALREHTAPVAAPDRRRRHLSDVVPAALAAATTQHLPVLRLPTRADLPAARSAADTVPMPRITDDTTVTLPTLTAGA